MVKDPQSQLEELGLSAPEANVYFTLLRAGGTLGASAVSAATGIPRTNVYPILNSLTGRGIVEAEAGYGSRFTALSPDKALPLLIARERDEQRQRLSHRERVAEELVQQLQSVAAPATADLDAEQIQVIRDPRVATDRYERLQIEAKRRSDAFVKYPIFNVHRGNPTQAKAIRRGVRYRTVYERAILDAPEIKPYLSEWIAEGEEARVYDGELPHKLVIVDEQSILLPLVTPGREARTLYIRHPQLGESLTLLFESFWNMAEPIPRAADKRQSKRVDESREKSARISGAGPPGVRRTGRNNHVASKRA